MLSCQPLGETGSDIIYKSSYKTLKPLGFSCTYIFKCVLRFSTFFSLKIRVLLCFISSKTIQATVVGKNTLALHWNTLHTLYIRCIRNVNRAQPSIRSIQRFCIAAALHRSIVSVEWRTVAGVGALSYYSFEAAVRAQCHRQESRGRTNAHAANFCK